MPGHYGVEQITLSGLRIVNCDPKEDIIYVVGSVPGAKNSLLTIEKQK